MEYVPRRTSATYCVLRRVNAIPEGFVQTYADVSPGAPRFAGSVLHAFGDEVPWWRVVRSDGSLAKGRRQRSLLDAEGVPFRGERVEMRVARRVLRRQRGVVQPTVYQRGSS